MKSSVLDGNAVVGLIGAVKVAIAHTSESRCGKYASCRQYFQTVRTSECRCLQHSVLVIANVTARLTTLLQPQAPHTVARFQPLGPAASHGEGSQPLRVLGVRQLPPLRSVACGLPNL